MKKLIAAVVLASAAIAGPALADGGVSVRVREPGVYGELNLGHLLPRLLDPAGIFLRHDRDRDEYAPPYRQEHARDRHEGRREDWRDDRRDDRYDRRDDRRDDRREDRHGRRHDRQDDHRDRH